MFLRRNVTSEEIGLEFTAVITARDGGTPMLSADTEVVVRVLDCTTDPFRFAYRFSPILSQPVVIPTFTDLSSLSLRVK